MKIPLLFGLDGLHMSDLTAAAEKSTKIIRSLYP
jgi:hypothetical protein